MKIEAVTKRQIVYKLTAIKRDSQGNEISRRESGEIPNLFTNFGVEVMYGGAGSGTGTSPETLGAVVGTGSAAPAVTDTALDTFLAGRYDVSSPTWSFVDLGSNQGYVQESKDTLFPVGVATGNISEVGACFEQSNPTNSYPLCSRALVVDGGGSPTTFEVLADEELLLTQMFRAYVNYADRVSVVNVNGVDYTITLRPLALASATYWRVFGSFLQGNGSSVMYGTGYTLADPTGTSSPTGTGTGAGAKNIAQGLQSGTIAYTPDSKQRAAYLRDTTGVASNISGATFEMYGHGSWQVGFSPSIPKSALERFTITLLRSIDNTP